MHHRKRGADAPPLRLHKAPASEAGDRLARRSPEEGRRVALLPIGDGNPDATRTLTAHPPDSEDPNSRVRGPFYPLGLEVPGRPSRWITTTALTVLRRAGR